MNYLYAVLAGAVLVIVSFIGGCHYNADEAEAKTQKVRAQDLQIALQMEPGLEHTLTVSHTVTVTLTKQVTKYVDHYIPAPGAASQARPAYYLTNGALQLWNSRLGASATADAHGPVAGADPLNLSTVTFDDAETNAIENFGQYADCRTVVQGWQDWYKKVSKVKP